MANISTHLWFNTEAKEAAQFYANLFPNSTIKNSTTLSETPSGTVDLINIDLNGHSFTLLSAGPLFRINPSISFMVNLDPSKQSNAEEELNRLWNALAEGGKILMPIDAYPFSKRYGWVEDRFGVSWQLILTNPEGEERPMIVPSLLFVTESGKQAEEATDAYLSVFKDSRRGTMARYPKGMEPNEEGAVMFTDFMLNHQWFAAMDGRADMHHFAFNEAVSFMVHCEDQAEIDYYWNALSAVPEAEQCGWLKDRFGVSWQIVPTMMDDMMRNGTKEQMERVTKAFLAMKKFDIAELTRAFNREE